MVFAKQIGYTKKMNEMKTLRDLTSEELISINGGKVTKQTSFAEDVGTFLGFILGVLGKGASRIHG